MIHHTQAEHTNNYTTNAVFHYYIFQAFINTFGFKYTKFKLIEGPGWLNELGSWIILIQAYHQYGVGLRPAL
jgi:hypothetical protein